MGFVKNAKARGFYLKACGVGSVFGRLCKKNQFFSWGIARGVVGCGPHPYPILDPLPLKVRWGRVSVCP